MIKIRQATVKDLNELVALDKIIFPAYYDDSTVNLSRLQIYPEGCFLVSLNEKNIGFITFEIWAELHEPKENTPAYVRHDVNGSILHLTNLGILPEFQNKGIGDELIKFVIKKAREKNLRLIILNTRSARKFYEKHGFTLVKHEKLPTHEHDIMQLKL